MKKLYRIFIATVIAGLFAIPVMAAPQFTTGDINRDINEMVIVDRNVITGALDFEVTIDNIIFIKSA